MRSSDADLIRGFALFRGISDAIFDEVTADAAILDLPPDHVLLTEGERPEHLFLLLSGLIESFSQYNGKTTTLSFLRPPAALIVAAVWMDQPQLHSARTLARSRLATLPARAVRAALATDRAFCEAAGRELSIRYRDIFKELKNQRLRNATDRLANWLLTESQVAGSDEFRIAVGKATLAARLGISGEHISRAFAQLREHGVETDGKEMRINTAKLTAFAKPDPMIDGAEA
ncbi:MAG: cyclic nucleotide-binding domain-containing protein [Hyphomicrobiales bacterium]|nr:cyclic nucleotide-binding domain-containing protein [Hyphomicrobiales bacterium]MDE2114983.1 cyclic nucleotide-binding domain-containing protein [Hyphomicrobiales bacterium]